MRAHQHFFTEMKENSASSFSGYHKPSQHSLYEQSFPIKTSSSPSVRNLTIKVFEAKLIVDVSMFGKMRTYAKVKLGNMIWQTNFDKESHMNPRWNESKTFDLTNICKSIKGLDMPLRNSMSRHNSGNKGWEDSKTVEILNSDDFEISVTVYHKSFLQDTEIGHASVSMKDLLKTRVTSEWLVLKTKKDIAGSILVSFELDGADYDVLTAYPKMNLNAKMSSAGGSSYGGDRFHSKSSSRLTTEPHRPSKLPIFGKTRPAHGSQNIQPTYYGKRSDSTNIRRMTSYSPYQSVDYDHFSSLPQSRDPSRINRSYVPSRNKPEERTIEVANTLITYEYHHDDDDNPHRQQFYEQFFASKEHNEEEEEEEEDSEVTNCDISSDMGDEGIRQMDTHDYSSTNFSYDTYKSEGEVHKVLEVLKKENVENRSKELEIKENLGSIKMDLNKLSQERRNIKQKENALLLREQCIKNEIKNLNVDFENLEREQEKLRKNAGEIDRLRAQMAKVKREEEMQKASTTELENNVKGLSLFLQREAQKLKNFEQNMYKKLIARRVMEMQAEEENSNWNNDSMFQENGLMTDRSERKSSMSGVDHVSALNGLREQRMKMEKEMHARNMQIEQLKNALRSYDRTD